MTDSSRVFFNSGKFESAGGVANFLIELQEPVQTIPCGLEAASNDAGVRSTELSILFSFV